MNIQMYDDASHNPSTLQHNMMDLLMIITTWWNSKDLELHNEYALECDKMIVHILYLYQIQLFWPWLWKGDEQKVLWLLNDDWYSPCWSGRNTSNIPSLLLVQGVALVSQLLKSPTKNISFAFGAHSRNAMPLIPSYNHYTKTMFTCFSIEKPSCL